MYVGSVFFLKTKNLTIKFQLLLSHIKEPIPNLKHIQESFNHINNVYRTWVEAEIQTQSAIAISSPTVGKSQTPPPVLIDQTDIYTHIFEKLDTENELEKLEWVLIAYLRSLFEYGIPALHVINELLVTTLVSMFRTENIDPNL